MKGVVFVRGAFAAALVYMAVFIHPLDAHILVNAVLGLVLAAVITFAETRMLAAKATG